MDDETKALLELAARLSVYSDGDECAFRKDDLLTILKLAEDLPDNPLNEPHGETIKYRH